MIIYVVYQNYLCRLSKMLCKCTPFILNFKIKSELCNFIITFALIM